MALLPPVLSGMSRARRTTDRTEAHQPAQPDGADVAVVSVAGGQESQQLAARVRREQFAAY
jgi:hypothetical protein